MAADLFFRTIPELNRMLVQREMSAREMATAFCDRLEKFGPPLNALAVSTRRTALEMAKDVDDELKRKRLRGPLQGIPFAAKDLLAYPGYPTTWGAKPFAAQSFDFKATTIEKLEARGALLVGKLSMVELAGGGGYEYADASMFGPGLNPWDLSRWAGGSSSGSGSAVAAGLVPFALGSETWGSILTPAAYCGITGLRPTYGYVSRHGAMPLSWTMDKIGPLCRSAEDCGLVLQVISGGDNKDLGSSGKSFYYGPEYVRELSRLKVGYNPVDFEEWAEPEMRPAFREAIEVLRRTGIQLEEIDEFPDMPYGTTASMIIDAEGSSVFEPLITSGQIDELADAGQIAGMKAALDLKSTDYLRAMRIRTRIQDKVTPIWRNLDIILAPSTTRTANRIDQSLRTRASSRPRPEKRGLRDLGAIGNLLGWPALFLPCGFAESLPVSIQLVSRPFNENRLLALGVAFQNETNWHLQRPPFPQD